ncbi:mannose-1-phosphate guanylyltransferase/mannose-6-phosphate isomerase [Sphingosinicellaceae bacterium]|nr:mannose-1-phosphate guanylyltransferase/mannose-6-phosphate isomerase [Sphingosinicellaceae bacterium]
MNTIIWPVILSGGAGTRLWPLSVPALPKQLLALTGARTMLQETALRTAGAGYHAPVIVCGTAHAVTIATQLGEIGVNASATIVEPMARNTAPAIALAALEVAARDSAGVMLVMPSDHVIDLPEALLAGVERAASTVAEGWLTTFGIAPTGPETGYGYIETGTDLAPGVHVAARFVEKPDRATAEAMLATGNFAWNGGLFLFRADAYLAALADHAPAVHAAATAAFTAAHREGTTVHPDADAFGSAPSISVDYAVMEKAAKVSVVPVDIGWSDIGSWNAVHAHGTPDAHGNVTRGPVLLADTSNCLVRTEGPLVATLGVAGLIIVVTNGAVLVAAADRAQEVKDIVSRLPKA